MWEWAPVLLRLSIALAVIFAAQWLVTTLLVRYLKAIDIIPAEFKFRKLFLLSATGVLFLLAIRGILPPRPYLESVSEKLLIILFTWLLIRIVHIGKVIFNHRVNIRVENNLRQRKLVTQVQYLERIVMIVIVVVGLCALLMTFDHLRKLGLSLLTSAGVIGVVVGFSAQKVIANLVAGFQLAFTQPIRIDDAVVFEGEFGVVEEITLTYVVIRVWDQRRVIVPISYLLERPFQNWTRNSTELIGVVLLYFDYSVPVEEVRSEVKRVLESTTLWDGRVNAVQLTEVTERTIQLRILVSSRDAASTFELRCLVREAVIKFVQKNYAGGLPCLRVKGDLTRAE